MNERLDGVLAAMRDALRLEPEAVEALGITAWNAHYRLRLEGRPHHLVIYTLPDPNAINGLVFEHKLLRHLQGRHFDLVPKLTIVNKDSLFPFEGGWFAITEWIGGCRQEDDPPLRPAQIDSMAAGLADLHGALRDLDMTLDYHPEHVFVYPLPAFMGKRDELFKRLRGRMDGPGFGDQTRKAWPHVRPGVQRFLDEFPLDLYWETVHAVRAGIVHGDFRGMNAAFDGDRLTYILDFNCCFNELRLWDVAYTALGLGGNETVGKLVDLDRPARFLKAYNAVAPLHDLERALLPAMLTFVVAKLMVGAFESWWIDDRVEMFAALRAGQAEEIVARAGLA